MINMNESNPLLEQIRSLLEMSNSGLSEEKFLSEALEFVSEISGSSGAYFHTFDEHENAIDLVAWSKAVHAYCEVMASSHYPLESAGIWADCVRQKKPVFHNDYAGIPASAKGGLPEGHFALHRHMSVPVFSQNRVVSIVGVANKESPYNDSDAENVKVLSELIWMILEQRRAQKIMAEYAFEDGLTGIANRRHFDMAIKEEWNRHRRTETSLGLIMFDIDLFKNLNDKLGHDEGDICLQKVARALQAAYRRSGELVCRYGGEEFMVILPNTTLEECAARAEYGRKVIEEIKIIHPGSSVSNYVTVSGGYASVIPDNADFLHFEKSVDLNLYKAKHQGRNCVVG